MSAKEAAIINFPENTQPKTSFLSKSIDYLSSVRFGIILLLLLVFLCFLGMIIRQENVTGFEAYFAELSLFQQILYSSLGLFDIYHSWYFTATLGLLSLNIILASAERFPKPGRLFHNLKLLFQTNGCEDKSQVIQLLCKEIKMK